MNTMREAMDGIEHPAHSSTCLYAKGQMTEPDRAVCGVCAAMPAARSTPVPASDVSEGLPRLSGESPCSFSHGLDGWTTCVVHGWSGPKEQRSRVIVCPSVNEGAALAHAARAGLDVERLARAMETIPPYPDEAFDRKWLLETPTLPSARQWASAIAAEYARLSQPDATEEALR